VGKCTAELAARVVLGDQVAERAQRVLGLLRIFFKGCDRTRHAPTLQYVTPHSGPWVGQTGARRETNRNERPNREESRGGFNP
jgi:hypothetical protein